LKDLTTDDEDERYSFFNTSRTTSQLRVGRKCSSLLGAKPLALASIE
jgi:hypothetical protein